MKYISADALADTLESLKERKIVSYVELVSEIASIPAADVQPVVRARWNDNCVAFYRGCPKCGAFVSANLDDVFLRDFPSAIGRLNFCPNCGADMSDKEREC